MVPLKSIIAAACRAAATLSPAEALARAASEWRMGPTIDGWFPRVKGNTKFSPPPGSERWGGLTDLANDFGDEANRLGFDGPAIAINVGR